MVVGKTMQTRWHVRVNCFGDGGFRGLYGSTYTFFLYTNLISNLKTRSKKPTSTF